MLNKTIVYLQFQCLISLLSAHAVLDDLYPFHYVKQRGKILRYWLWTILTYHYVKTKIYICTLDFIKKKQKNQIPLPGRYYRVVTVIWRDFHHWC